PRLRGVAPGERPARVPDQGRHHRPTRRLDRVRREALAGRLPAVEARGFRGARARDGTGALTARPTFSPRPAPPPPASGPRPRPAPRRRPASNFPECVPCPGPRNPGRGAPPAAGGLRRACPPPPG